MIRFDQVSKVYKRGARPALNEVDIEIERGEFVFLVGASGSGKSTFLRLVLREERPTSGSIHVLGRDLSQVSTCAAKSAPCFRTSDSWKTRTCSKTWLSPRR